MRKYLFSILLFVFLSLFYTRCTSNKFDVDVSGVDLLFDSKRLDQDVFHHQTEDILTNKKYFQEKYGDFFKVFVEQIIRIGPSDSLKTYQELNKFAKDKFVMTLQNHVEKMFPEEKIIDIDNQFVDGFKHYKYYFPNAKIPEVVYYNSGFNYGIVTLENYLGIGLDFYLGKNDSLIKIMPGEVFHQYEKDKMDPKYFVRDSFDGWLKNNLDALNDKKNLLSIIVNEGKRMYILNAILPNVKKEVLMRYTPEEWQWAEKNKRNIWRELAKQKVIYGTKNFDNQKWVTEGPFTNVGAIPEDSPARLGSWMGWQMVQAYMDDHPEMTIQQLFKEKNYQLILNAYKP